MTPIESPGDVFRPGADMTEAKRRSALADEMAGRRDGMRWRPTAGRTVLVDNRRHDPGAPVQLKTAVFGSVIVTEWIPHHIGPSTYRVFEVDRLDTEKHFEIEEAADALSYHAELEAAARRREFDRRAAARALRFWQPALAESLEPADECDPWEEAADVAEADHACFVVEARHE